MNARANDAGVLVSRALSPPVSDRIKTLTIEAVSTPMPRLLLLRHAKSSWADPGMKDRDRPLSPEGHHAAEQMARELVRADLLPDQILCSPARRTRETLAALHPYLDGDCPITICDELYDAEHDDYRATITSYSGDPERLLVIGHNPTIHATALNLIGSADSDSAALIATKFPPAALAIISFDSENWTLLRPKSGYLQAFIRARDLDHDHSIAKAD